MDEGPFRMPPRPADRSPANRPEPEPRPREEPQPVKEEGPKKIVHRPTAPHHRMSDKRSLGRFVVPAVIAIVVIIIAIIGFAAFSKLQGSATAIDSSKYQAVFFTNGQVYFGKLQSFSSEYMKLTDVYYLQTQANEEAADPKNPQQTGTDQSNPTLIKLGDEIHGPEDAMIISKDQVLFYENLKSDGKVSQSIDKFKNPN